MPNETGLMRISGYNYKRGEEGEIIGKLPSKNTRHIMCVYIIDRKKRKLFKEKHLSENIR